MKSTCSHKYFKGESASVLTARSLRTTSICGQWFRASHIKLGKKIASAIAPPSQSHRRRNSRGIPDASRPTTVAKPKTRMVCLLRNAIPVTSPNHSQRRGLPPLRMRAMRIAPSAQKTGSNAFMERKLFMARTAGANRIVTAARICARRLPPRSRASNPVRNTSRAPAAAGSNRVAARELPKACCETQATAAMNGGWST